jgi:hypothetical protein
MSEWSRKVVGPHLHLRSVDQLQQLLKDLADPWGLLWALAGKKRQNRDAIGQLLKGQQGNRLDFLGSLD